MFLNAKFLFCIFVSFQLWSSITALKCKDEHNNDVEWFYVYKYPGDETNDVKDTSNIYTGLHVFLTSEDHGEWKLSNISIASDSSIIANTLKPLYENNNNFYILYNDEVPNGPKNVIKGHTKGVIVGDSTGGIWLIHSVPKFPDTDSYIYPMSGMTYGQSFLCLSLDLDNLNDVGLQLQYNQPNIYSSKMVPSLNFALKNLVDASENMIKTEAPYFRKTTLSLDGYDFVSFAKSKYFEKDLYIDLVALELKSGLLAETWLNGPGRMVSNCSERYSVKNVESVKIKNIKFRNSKDHSKWAVSDGEKDFWICVGDINREEHQKFRGGGTVCIENKLLSRAYLNLIQDVEECSSHSNNFVL